MRALFVAAGEGLPALATCAPALRNAMMKSCAAAALAGFESLEGGLGFAKCVFRDRPLNRVVPADMPICERVVEGDSRDHSHRW